jgi:NADH-quinone oxidoreductase subunit J
MEVVFYLSGAIAILATALAVSRRNAIHALLFFIVSLLAVAVIFLSLGALFIAALEVIVFAGAIMVLFVFVVMMINAGADSEDPGQAWRHPSAWVGPAVLTIVLGAELIFVLTQNPGALTSAAEVSPMAVGIAMLGPYVIGVELASLLLLVGLVVAYHLGRRVRKTNEGEEI